MRQRLKVINRFDAPFSIPVGVAMEDVKKSILKILRQFLLWFDVSHAGRDGLKIKLQKFVLKLEQVR